MLRISDSQLKLLENIPQELSLPKLWLGYYLAPNSNKPDKKPNKRPCVKWGTPELRVANLRSLDYLLTERELQAGYQRWIDKDEGLVYVDLDHARNAATGEVEPWAKAIIDTLDTYCEVSASGTGFHLVCRGKLDEDFYWPGQPVEIYAGNINKLMAMTGDIYEFNPTINDRQSEVEALLKEWQAKVGPDPEKAVSKEPTKPDKEVRPWREVFHTGSELGGRPSRVFIKGILEEGITYFGALSDTGKTWIGLSIAHALITKEKLFGLYPVLNKCNVLYLVPEMGGSKFKARLEKMRLPMDGSFFCQTVQDGAIDLNDASLLQAIREMRPAVILDTAIRFQTGDEQSSTEQAQGLGAKFFRLIREGAQLVICMHHRKKDAGDVEPTLENTLRGTGDFGAMADCVWCVETAKQRKGKTWDEEYTKDSKALTRLALTNVKSRDMIDLADPFVIQGRPHIDQKGDFVVLADVPNLGCSQMNDDAAAIKAVLGIATVGSTIGLLAIRKHTGYSTDRVKRILDEAGRKKEDGVWVQGTVEVSDLGSGRF
jgi:hypothetical protein